MTGPAGDSREQAVATFVSRYDRALSMYLANVSSATNAFKQNRDSDAVAWHISIDSFAVPLLESYRRGVQLWTHLPPSTRDTIGMLLAANAAFIDTLLQEIELDAAAASAPSATVATFATIGAAPARLTPRSIIRRCETTLDKIKSASDDNSWWARAGSFSVLFGPTIPMKVLGTGLSVVTAIADVRLAYSRHNEALVPRREGGNLALTFTKEGTTAGGDATIDAVVVLEPIGNSLGDLVFGAGSAISIPRSLDSFFKGLSSKERTSIFESLRQFAEPWILQPDMTAWYERVLDYEQRFTNWRKRSDKRRVIRVDPELVYFSPTSGKEWSVRSHLGLQLYVTANPRQTYWQFFTPQEMNSARASEPGFDVCNLTPATPTTTGSPLLNAFQIERAAEKVTLFSATVALLADGVEAAKQVLLKNNGRFETPVSVRLAPGFAPPGGVGISITRGDVTLPMSGMLPVDQLPILRVAAQPGSRTQRILVPLVVYGTEGKVLSCAISRVTLFASGSTGLQSPDGKVSFAASGGTNDPKRALAFALMLNGEIVHRFTLPGDGRATLQLKPGYNRIYYLYQGGPTGTPSVTFEFSGLQDQNGAPAVSRRTHSASATLASPGKINLVEVGHFLWQPMSQEENDRWSTWCESIHRQISEGEE